ncbi:MAG: hypothetical protein GY842_17160, partial [bacterium]|nr:hypothetical protein [bacterium]
GDGGGMYSSSSSPTLTNCTFSGNSAYHYGGGMYSSSSSPTLTNCTFSGNSAYHYGGGMFNNRYTSPTLTNCILWGNTDQSGVGQAAQITGGTPYIDYTCVQGWPGLLNGTGNIGVDPLFVDPDGPDGIVGTMDDDLHLHAGSPCIDIGDNDAVPDGLATDIDGDPRILSCRVDMGVDESPNTGIDCNDSGLSDGCDIHEGTSQDVDGNGVPDECQLILVFVDVDATGANDGTSWANAFTDLQDALDVVLGAGGEIRVATGVYAPADPGGDRGTSFQIIPSVAIYGGYAGFGAPDPDLRNVVLHETILSGDLDGDDGPDFANNAENSFHVVTGGWTDGTAVLDGFTITAGNANGPYEGFHHDTVAGGGMYNASSSPTLTNCTFSGNSAGDVGGGMYNSSYSSPTLTNCTFNGNSAWEEGGGMCNRPYSSPTLTNCTFTGNLTNHNGGGMISYSSPTLNNCTFSGNSADWNGGGMLNYSDSSPTLNNCTFTGNSADWNGGGMYNYSSSSMTNCTFTGNSADDDGGGMCNYSSSSSTVLTNCTFNENTAWDNGGGMFNVGDATLTNCTFSGNSAVERGGGMYSSGEVTLNNCIMWWNYPTQIDGGSLITSSCAIQPDWDYWSSSALYPMLTQTAHLTSSSAMCVDAGDNSHLPADTDDLDNDGNVTEPMPFDIDGDSRFMDDPDVPDTGQGTPPIVDIGADEFVDSDSDGLPDWWESKYFGDPVAADTSADADTDGLSNDDEYEDFSSNPIAHPIHVNVTGSEPADGTVGNPFLTIQQALDVAQDGDTVLVADGIYAGTGNTPLDFHGRRVVLHAPDGASLSCESNPATVPIVLSSIRGTGSAVVGFDIASDSIKYGGGFDMSSYSLFFRDCTIHSRNNCNLDDHVFRLAEGYMALGGITLGDSTDGWCGNGVIERAWVHLDDDITLENSHLDLRSASIAPDNLQDPETTIEIGEFSLVTISSNSPGAEPTVLYSNISGQGRVDIHPGQTLEVRGRATVDMGVPALRAECGDVLDDAGSIVIKGTLAFYDESTIRNTRLYIDDCDFENVTEISNSSIVLPETSRGYGGFLKIDANATVTCNRIESEGDRYLSFDPDPYAGNRPEFEDNKFYVRIRQGLGGGQATPLELRTEDFDCIDSNGCVSGAFLLLGSSPGYDDAWTLQELEVMADASVVLTNRKGFEFNADTSPHPDVLYAKKVILHPGATLNTGLQRMYYQSLVDSNGVELVRDPQDPSAPLANGSRIVDVPLLGFSVVVIRLDDDPDTVTDEAAIEYEARISRRVTDSSKAAPPSKPVPADAEGDIGDKSCTGGAVTLLYEAAVQQTLPDWTGGGLMEMRTAAPGCTSASSVAAKGGFARAGDEDIVIQFDYLFREADAGTQLNVYLSDEPGVGDRIFKVAEIAPPPSNLPGGTGSERMATFVGAFPRVVPGQYTLNFTRGTYVELELAGTYSRVWIDNFDPWVECQDTCADFDWIAGVDDQDYLILLAEGGQALPEDKLCLDITGDGYVDMSDVLALDVVFDTELNLCPAPEGLRGDGAAAKAGGSRMRSVGDQLLIAGKPSGTGMGDQLYHADTNGICSGVGEPLECPGSDCTRGAARLVQDPAGTVYVVHGVHGLIRQDTGAPIVIPAINKPYGVDKVAVGVVEEGDVPLADAAFSLADMGSTGPEYVYVLPVVVTPASDETSPYRAAARLELLGAGDFVVDKVLGLNPAEDPDPCVNTTVTVRGGSVKPLCDLTGMRELAVDADGNVFVASATQYNDNDWLLLYNPGTGNPDQAYETARIKLNELFAGEEFPVPAGPGALLVSALSADVLYLASSINASNSLMTRVYRFNITHARTTATGLTFTGAVEVDQPTPSICDSQIACDEYVSSIVSLHEASDGTLYVLGFSAPEFGENADLYTIVDEMFTTATLASIPAGASWSTSLVGVTSVSADRIIGSDLALPISAVYLGAVPGDFDGDGDVDLDDYAMFAGCMAGTGVFDPPAGCDLADFSSADLDDDSDVDCDDWVLLRDTWTGPPAEPPVLPECDNAVLVDSAPAHDDTLWRNANNFIRLTFDSEITDPGGAIQIRTLESGGTYGATDYSSNFTFTVVDDGFGAMRVLEIQENGSSLLPNTTWIGVYANPGAW